MCVSPLVGVKCDVCFSPSGCAGAGGEAADGCEGEGEPGGPAAGLAD